MRLGLAPRKRRNVHVHLPTFYVIGIISANFGEQTVRPNSGLIVQVKLLTTLDVVYTFTYPPRSVDIGLPGKGNPKSHGARPVHLIIWMIRWIRTSRLSITLYTRSPAQFGTLLDSRTTTSQKCEAVPRRARI